MLEWIFLKELVVNIPNFAIFIDLESVILILSNKSEQSSVFDFASHLDNDFKRQLEHFSSRIG